MRSASKPVNDTGVVSESVIQMDADPLMWFATETRPGPFMSRVDYAMPETWPVDVTCTAPGAPCDYAPQSH